MKRLLVSLWVGGAALYTANTFIFVHSVNLTKHPQITSSSVGPSASDSASQSRSTISPPSEISQAQVTLASDRQNAKPDGAAPDQRPEDRATEEPPTPLADAVTKQPADERSGTTASEDTSDPAEWAEVSQAAHVHNGPSVSAPTVRYFPLGTRLQVIGREDGWVHVAEPTTSQEGWIYEQYLTTGSPDTTQVPVCTENLNPDVVVMKSAKDRV